MKEALGLTDDEAWGPPVPGSTSEAFQTLLCNIDPWTGQDDRVKTSAIITAMGDYEN